MDVMERLEVDTGGIKEALSLKMSFINPCNTLKDIQIDTIDGELLLI